MSWSTADELAFVRNLGAWRQANFPPPEEHLALLKHYRQSCEKRAYWGQIDRAQVLAEADRLIAEVTARLGRVSSS